jgi:hypothetical protein
MPSTGWSPWPATRAKPRLIHRGDARGCADFRFAWDIYLWPPWGSRYRIAATQGCALLTRCSQRGTTCRAGVSSTWAEARARTRCAAQGQRRRQLGLVGLVRARRPAPFARAAAVPTGRGAAVLPGARNRPALPGRAAPGRGHAGGHAAVPGRRGRAVERADGRLAHAGAAAGAAGPAGGRRRPAGVPGGRGARRVPAGHAGPAVDTGGGEPLAPGSGRRAGRDRGPDRGPARGCRLLRPGGP